MEYAQFNNPQNVPALEIYHGTRFFITGEIQRVVRGEVSIDDAARLLAAHALRQRIATEEEFKNARHDPLTGLPTRLAFLEELEKHVNAYNELRKTLEGRPEDEYTDEEREKLQKASFGVLFIDLDDFKKKNDTYGHDVGDEILKEASSRLQRNVRQGHIAMPEGVQEQRNIEETDLAARYGGEELVGIIGGVRTEDELSVIGNRIITAFNEEPFSTASGPLPQTASIGGAIYIGGNVMDTLKLADQRVYGAKQQGKNVYSGKEIGPKST